MTRASRSRYQSLFAMTMRLRQRVPLRGKGRMNGRMFNRWIACTAHASSISVSKEMRGLATKVKQATSE